MSHFTSLDSNELLVTVSYLYKLIIYALRNKYFVTFFIFTNNINKLHKFKS